MIDRRVADASRVGSDGGRLDLVVETQRCHHRAEVTVEAR